MEGPLLRGRKECWFVWRFSSGESGWQEAVVEGCPTRGRGCSRGHPSGCRVMGPVGQALGVRLWTVYLFSHLLILSPELPGRLALCREVA